MLRRGGVREWEWLLLDGKGEMELVEAGKDAIMRRIGLRACDLHDLGSDLSYPSILFGCERFTIINLKYVKAIITLQEVLLLNSRDPSVTLFVQELQARILRHHQGSPSSKHHSDHDLNPNSDAIKILPFEFIVFEGCLEAACSVLENEAANMLEQVHSDLEKLTSNISNFTLNWNLGNISERVRKMKNNLNKLNNLKRLLVYNVRGSTYPAVQQFDVKELKMLLEHYSVQMDGTLKKLLKVRKYVVDVFDVVVIENYIRIEQYIDFMLDYKAYRRVVLFVLMSAIGFLSVVVFAWNKLKRSTI